jgi:sensor domain CHASE-containing protein
MKFLIYGLVVLAATVYVAESQHLAETLIRRAEEIVHRAEADLLRHHGEGRQHLTVELEREIQLVRHLVSELRALPEGHHLEQHHFLELEERLLHHENRLAEELARIEGHNDNAPHERHVLEERAHALLQRAEHDIARIHGEGRGHLVQEIQHEVERIRELVHELRAHPSTHLDAEHARQIEQRLAEHERRLAEELRRIEGQH